MPPVATDIVDRISVRVVVSIASRSSCRQDGERDEDPPPADQFHHDLPGALTASAAGGGDGVEKLLPPCDDTFVDGRPHNGVRRSSCASARPQPFHFGHFRAGKMLFRCGTDAVRDHLGRVVPLSCEDENSCFSSVVDSTARNFATQNGWFEEVAKLNLTHSFSSVAISEKGLRFCHWLICRAAALRR
jgi:hypothetical protein